MTNNRKKKRHKCKNHPSVEARGRCMQCNGWVCRDCAEISNGQIMCVNGCGVRAEKEKTTPDESATPDRQENGESLILSTRGLARWIIPCAGVALFSGLLAFTLFLWRENGDLKKEIQTLSLSRREFTEQIEKRNRYIKKLKARIAAADTADTPKRESTPRNTIKRTHKLPPAYREIPIFNKIPLNVENGATQRKLISLTFDGGSYANAADDILDTLKSRNVKATMFVTGHFIRRYPEVLKRCLSEGHEIGNHMYSHPRLTTYADTRTHKTRDGVTPEFVRQQLLKANAVFRETIGAEFAPIWRAPYGEKNPEICRWARENGYLHVGWRQGRTWRRNLDTNDWIPDEDTPGYHSPEEVYRKIMNIADTPPYGMNGGIVLLHLGTTRKEKHKQVHHIIGRIIDDLRAREYQVVPVTVLLKESGIELSHLRERMLMAENR